MIRSVLVIITISLIFISCKRKSQTQPIRNHPVASIPVDVTLYPNDPLHFSIQAIGGWKYIPGGLNGIIVYRKSQQEFVALERTSSYYPDKASAKVIVLPDNFTCKDTISGSKWQIFDGTVIEGPAEWALRLYGTSYDGNALRIKN